MNLNDLINFGIIRFNILPEKLIYNEYFEYSIKNYQTIIFINPNSKLRFNSLIFMSQVFILQVNCPIKLI